MRRGFCDEPYEEWDGGDSPRRSRVTRLADLLEGEGRGDSSTSQSYSLPDKAVGGRQDDTGTITLGTGVSRPTILSVTPEGSGDMIAVVLAIPPRDSMDYAVERPAQTKKPHRMRICLLAEQYAELRSEGICLECGDISEEHAARLTDAGELCEAIRRGMAALEYGDRSARRLIHSLTAKGVARQRAEDAVAYLTRKGYVREEDAARRRVSCDLRKGWGPRRIREDLRAQGLESRAVEAAMEELSEVDFRESCAEVIRKKYGMIPADRGERQKMTAALMRLGYDLDHIRGAARLLARENP